MAEARSSIARAAAARDKPAKPYEVRAEQPAGLLLRVQPSGFRAYYVQVARGKRIRIGPAGTYTLEQAKTRARQILLDPASAKRTSTAATLAEYVDGDYREHAIAKLKNGARSIARVKAVWKPLLSKRVADIAAIEVDRLRNKRLLAGVSKATVNRDVAALSGALAHWAEHNDVKHPLAGLEALHVPDDERVRYLRPEESKRLRAALKARDDEGCSGRASANKWRSERGYELLPRLDTYCDHITPMVVLSLNSGIRQGELFSLTWESIDLSRKTLTVLASHSKGNTTRHIPLNAEALSVLKAIKPRDSTGLVFKSPKTGGRFDNVKKAWAQIVKGARLPDLRWHDIRHNFASQLVMRGVPLYTVQKLLGHANPKMTQRYARLAPAALAEAVDLLDEGRAVRSPASRPTASARTPQPA